MIARLQQEYPGLVIAGTDAPPFRELTPEEDALAVARINQAQPDLCGSGWERRSRSAGWRRTKDVCMG